jgi:hypothetical protein
LELLLPGELLGALPGHEGEITGDAMGLCCDAAGNVLRICPKGLRWNPAA